MQASTHTEVYRAFGGRLRPARPRFWPLYRSRVRVLQKKKLPLLLLYAPPAISGIVYSFIVYGKFTLEAGQAAGGLPPGAAMAAAVAGQLLEVHNQIIEFTQVIRFFALLVIAWYGAGLISEDNKAGAHLLYFSRPLTRTDYFLAHFATAVTFGLRAILLPGLVICTVAVFSSPDYAFLKEKWNVILATVGFSLIYVGVIAMIVLAVSSLVTRRTFALAGIFGLIVASQASAQVLRRINDDRDFLMVSLWNNFRRLADWMFDARRSRFDWDPWWSVAILAGVSLVCLAIVVWRLRRMEVVA
jgi:ABC-type transport system involved in multi-copper enzyme maturation permease subunit